MNKNKTLNSTFWIFSLVLIVFSIINQSYINYNYNSVKFLTTLVAFSIAIYLFLHTKQGAGFYKYWLSSVAELKKVTWPKKKEVLQLTSAVIVMVLITGIILWIVDSILIKLVSWFLQRRW